MDWDKLNDQFGPTITAIIKGMYDVSQQQASIAIAPLTKRIDDLEARVEDLQEQVARNSQ